MTKAVAARRGALALALALVVIGAVFGVRVAADAGSPAPSAAALLGPDYVDIRTVRGGGAEPAPVAGAATGTYSWDCGRNEIGHRNTANVVVVPGMPGPVHHVHDYVGNLSTDVSSTVDSLAGGGTTCANGDESTYYWPVLRTLPAAQAEHTAGHPGGAPGAPVTEHAGEIQLPVSLTLTFHGNPRTQVIPMPSLLRATMGDAVAITNGGARAQATWTCSDTPQLRTTRYPVCAAGQRVTRVFDFPSCWDGRQVDSTDHRQHLVFPVAGGGCPVATFAVPRLRLVATYDLPAGTRYRIDAFDGQRNSPLTDHAFFVNLMPEPVMAQVVRCLNAGEVCGDHAGSGR
ncbi:DUF1996 domain-containing protein [Micromonospora sp. NPDC049523]|uniref:DUF1996 domain-containing protein n=1 Tax=Micromonospora sp. NPDC049523 TaxID=3155921 RepID=UPI003423045D